MRTLLITAFVIVLIPSTAHAQGGSQWGPSFGILLGKFNSDDLGVVDDFVEEAVGYETQLKGRSWDLCAARGGIGRSMTRICYTQLRVDDGGGFEDEPFFETLTRDVLIKGFKVERIFRVGPARWPVAPMVNLHGGLGKISGAVAFTGYNVVPDSTQPTGFRRTTVALQEQQPVTEYWPKFSDDWTFLLGAGIGVGADLGQHATVNFGVYGMEFPGVHKVGLLQVTFWPR